MDFNMIMQVFGGLGLFILGMTLMSDGLKKVAGDKLKSFLDKVTSNPIKSVFLGTIITMIIQSSSATTVMVVGLVNAGLINLIQAAGVILGANIGTTITSQLIALKITDYAALFIAVGVVMKLFSKKDKVRNLGDTILGFGLLFTGINIMSDTLKPLADNQLFVDILVSFSDNPIMGVIAGAVITAIIQSSSASIGLLQALAIGGAFATVSATTTLSASIPILLGMNIGTCVTAIFSMIGANNTAKQAAGIHLMVNIFGTFWVLGILYITGGFTAEGSFIYDFIIKISGDDATRQIANSHTIFNVANTLVLLPLIPSLVKFIKKVIPDVEEKEEDKFKIRLDERLLENPTVALGETVDEVIRMGKLTYQNLNTAFYGSLKHDSKMIDEVFDVEEDINAFETGITDFLVKLSSLNLDYHDADLVIHLYHTIHDIERIGDHAVGIARIAQNKARKGIKFSESASSEVTQMYEKVKKALKLAIEALEEKNKDKAAEVLEIEKQINQDEKQLRKAHINRLNKQSCSAESGVLYLDFVTDMERIGDYADNIAKFVIESSL